MAGISCVCGRIEHIIHSGVLSQASLTPVFVKPHQDSLLASEGMLSCGSRDFIKIINTFFWYCIDSKNENFLTLGQVFKVP